MAIVAKQGNAERSLRPPRTCVSKTVGKMHEYPPARRAAIDPSPRKSLPTDAGLFLGYGLKTDHLTPHPDGRHRLYSFMELN